MPEKIIELQKATPPKLRRVYPSTLVGVSCNAAIVFLYIISFYLCATFLGKLKAYDRFGIYMFLGCMSIMTLDVTLITYLVFFRHIHHGLPNIMVFMYLLLEVVLVVIAWNLEIPAMYGWILFGITCAVFGIMFIYTCALSRSYYDWLERVRIWEEQMIEIQIEMLRYHEKGPCIYIPLTGPLPDYLKTKPSSSIKFDQPSTSQQNEKLDFTNFVSPAGSAFDQSTINHPSSTQQMRGRGRPQPPPKPQPKKN